MVPLHRQGRTVLRLDHQGHDVHKGARGSSAKRDDVDVAYIMRRSGNDVTLTRDKGRGLSNPEQIKLRRHSEPTCHLPLVADDKVYACVEALNRLGVPLNASRDSARDGLRAKNYKFGNEVIGAALKARRPSASGRDGTSQDG